MVKKINEGKWGQQIPVPEQAKRILIRPLMLNVVNSRIKDIKILLGTEVLLLNTYAMAFCTNFAVTHPIVDSYNKN